MEFKNLTETQKLPVLGLGTWRMGGERERDTSKDAECIAGIKKALELGYTHIDTAELYGLGHAEELVAQAIKAVDRKKLFITNLINLKIIVGLQYYRTVKFFILGILVHFRHFRHFP